MATILRKIAYNYGMTRKIATEFNIYNNIYHTFNRHNMLNFFTIHKGMRALSNTINIMT